MPTPCIPDEARGKADPRPNSIGGEDDGSPRPAPITLDGASAREPIFRPSLAGGGMMLSAGARSQNRLGLDNAVTETEQEQIQHQVRATSAALSME